MKRALRPDKLTLAYLAATLRCYEDPNTLTEHIPLLSQLTTPLEELTLRAETLQQTLAPLLPDYEVAVADSQCQIGSGALPDQRIPSKAVTLRHPQAKAVRQLNAQLRALRTPVIGRIHKDTLWLDMRGALPMDELVATLRAVGQ